MTEDIKKIVNQVTKQSQDFKKQQVELVQLAVFNLDNEEYAVFIADLKEIIKISDITPIPNAPDFINGILNLRGKIVVVVDLEKRFKLVRENRIKPEHIIIIEVGDNLFGVIVDRVSEILRVSVNSIQPSPALVSAKIRQSYLKGVVVLGKKEQNRELTVKECKKLLASHQKGKAIQKSDARLLILLDLPKMLEEKSLLQLGTEVKKATKK